MIILAGTVIYEAPRNKATAGLVIPPVVLAVMHLSYGSPLRQLVIEQGLFLLFATLSLLLRNHRKLNASLAREAALLASQREADTRAALVAERTRVARELHDVVAHAMSAITVQAGVGRVLAAQDPAAAVERLGQIEELSRNALNVMRRLLDVLRADDQQLVRVGFAALLGAMPDIEVVGEASDGIEAVDRVRDTGPDVVIMDIRMPRLDGIEATARLRQMDEPSAVIVVTTFDLDDYVYDALRAGAAGFLLKDTPPEDLVAAVRVVAAGDALLARSITRRLIAEFARSAPAPRPASPALDQLTERERDVLAQVATGRSNVEIAEALYVSEATVKSHLGRVMSELNLTSRAQAVVVAYESGLVTPGQTG